MKINKILRLIFIIVANIYIASYFFNTKEYLIIIFSQIALIQIFSLIKILLLPEEKQLPKGEFSSGKTASLGEIIIPIFQFYNSRKIHPIKETIVTLFLFPFMLANLLIFGLGIVFLPLILYSAIIGVSNSAPIMAISGPILLFFLYETVLFFVFLFTREEESAQNIVQRQKRITLPITIFMTIILIISNQFKTPHSFVEPMEIVLIITGIKIVCEAYSLLKEGKQE